MKRFRIENRRYLGSKAKLIGFIHEVVNQNCQGVHSVLDLFSGTGNVGWSFNDKKTKVIVNDLLTSNYISYLAWFGSQKVSAKTIDGLIDSYNKAKVDGENYFSETFSGTYFSHENCQKIGFIREDIENRFKSRSINERERAILITSLIYAMDKIANTVGHYDAYRMNGELNKSLILEPLALPEEGVNDNNEIYHEDSNELVKKIKADLVYIDPPYNSRQYCDSYHLLENVAQWEKPDVYGVAKKMKRSHEEKSNYCTQKAPLAFDDLLKNIDAKYIMVSYNNMGTKGAGRSQAKISDDDIIASLSKRGEVKVFSTDFNQFTTGKTHIDDHKERLFLCICGSIKDKKPIEEEGDFEGNAKSPLNYTGGKFRLLPQLTTKFENGEKTFVDLFGGGFNVGANVKTDNVIYLDKQEEVERLIKLIYEKPYSDLLGSIEKLIAKYSLSNTTENGYSFYKCLSDSGVGSYNKKHYEELRRDYNLATKSAKKDEMLLTLVFYSFNNQIRFNSKGEFNMPVGKRDFNSCARKNLREFSAKIKTKNIQFVHGDFESIADRLDKLCFVYCDPPYYLGTASYNENEGWTKKDEGRLLNFLASLDHKGVKFALSNLIQHHGEKHQMLIDWTQENRFNTTYIKSKYSNSNYHIKDKESPSVEVLITN